MIGTIVGVWESITTYLVGLFPTIAGIFYAENELTFIGTLAVVMAGISLVLLIFNLIRSFIKMRA